MSKLDDALPGYYAEMHAKGAFTGASWNRHYHDLFKFLGGDEGVCDHTVLDFGCGPTGGLAGKRTGELALGFENPLGLYDGKVVPYDPYVEKYAADPWGQPLTAFFTCDVFEHMPLNAIRSLLKRINLTSGITHVFVALSTRPANKLLPNGLNAHITLRSADWWSGFLYGGLGNYFELKASTAYLEDGEAVYQFVRNKSA